jgi:hypothetical protein
VARSADVIVCCWLAVSAWLPRGGPYQTCTVCSGWVVAVSMVLIEESRPVASTTAVSPAATAASVTAERPGRVNGAASPMLTGRGRASFPASRYMA